MHFITTELQVIFATFFRPFTCVWKNSLFQFRPPLKKKQKIQVKLTLRFKFLTNNIDKVGGGDKMGVRVEQN